MTDTVGPRTVTPGYSETKQAHLKRLRRIEGQVRGKAFVVWRGPRKDAVDPETGEQMDDVIMLRVPGAEDKEAILQSGPPWFTTPHFNGYNAVLVRERDLGELDYLELAEVVTDAWATLAPAKLVRQHLG